MKKSGKETVGEGEKTGQVVFGRLTLFHGV